MQEKIKLIFVNLDGLIFVVALVMIGLNIAMMSLSKFLGWLKDKTESKLDDKAYEVVTRVLRASQVALSYASANSALLPPKAKAEIEKKEWEDGVVPPPNLP